METEYQHDIGKLKGSHALYMLRLLTRYSHSCINIIEAQINGNELLSLDKGSLGKLGLSTEFEIPLMEIIKDLVCYYCE